MTSRTILSNRIRFAAEKMVADFLVTPDLESSLHKCESRNRACLVIDHEHESWDGQNHPALETIRPVLVVVSQGDVGSAFQAARWGANDVIEDPFQIDQLMVSLKSVLARAALAKDAENEDLKRNELKPFSCLSDREQSILDLLMNGELNKQVASKLDIGLRTVEADRAAIMRKLNVSSFVELIKLVTLAQFDPETRKKIDDIGKN